MVSQKVSNAGHENVNTRHLVLCSQKLAQQLLSQWKHFPLFNNIFTRRGKLFYFS